MNREKARKRAVNAEHARRFPARVRVARKAARKVRVAERERRWIERYDRLEHAAGHQGINAPPEPKNSKIGSDGRRRRRGRRGRPTSTRGQRPAALIPAESKAEALTCG